MLVILSDHAASHGTVLKDTYCQTKPKNEHLVVLYSLVHRMPESALLKSL